MPSRIDEVIDVQVQRCQVFHSHMDQQWIFKHRNRQQDHHELHKQ